MSSDEDDIDLSEEEEEDMVQRPRRRKKKKEEHPNRHRRHMPKTKKRKMPLEPVSLAPIVYVRISGIQGVPFDTCLAVRLTSGQVTMIKKSSIPPEVRPNPTVIEGARLTDVAGASVGSTASVVVQGVRFLEIGDKPADDFRAVIFDNPKCHHDIIAGADMLTEWGVCINFGDSTVSLLGEKGVRMKPTSDCGCYSVFTEEAPRGGAGRGGRTTGGEEDPKKRRREEEDVRHRGRDGGGSGKGGKKKRRKKEQHTEESGRRKKSSRRQSSSRRPKKRRRRSSLFLSSSASSSSSSSSSSSY